MRNYKTPGVYVQEKNAFGSSIVANETAVPIFIGFTEKTTDAKGAELPKINGSDNVRIPVLVRSILEYSQCFGGPDTTGTMRVTEEGSETQTYYSVQITKGGPNHSYAPGLLHPALENYFANGGGNCYILSLGNYSEFKGSEPGKVNWDAIQAAFEMAETCTLILPVDLIRYGTALYYSWCSQFINYCHSTKKQFCVLDVIMKDINSSTYRPQDIKTYRETVTGEALKYGAAYFPYLKSLTPYAYIDSNVIYKGAPLPSYSKEGFSYYGTVGFPDTNSRREICIQVEYNIQGEDTPPKVMVKAADPGQPTSMKFENSKWTLSLKQSTGNTEVPITDLTSLWKGQADKHGYQLTFLKGMAPSKTYTGEYFEGNSWVTEQEILPLPPLEVSRIGGLKAAITQLSYEIKPNAPDQAGVTLKITPEGNPETGNKLSITCIKDSTADKILEQITTFLGEKKPADIEGKYSFQVNKSFDANQKVMAGTFEMTKYLQPDNATIQQIKAFLAQNYIPLPPSPYIAGIYSRLDNASGVWTPPANVSPLNTTAPLVAISKTQQENMNVDATSGKSINAIRSFTGKGTLIWGARTNDGNSMDWRYINVCRLFIAIETDISKALEAFVFRPNVFNTWVEVKTMIDLYLFGLFQAGAFAGQTPETSYQVMIGVGETMTPEDVLNGYMRAFIRVAPVRPAEFIELTFSQMVGQ